MSVDVQKVRSGDVVVNKDDDRRMVIDCGDRGLNVFGFVGRHYYPIDSFAFKANTKKVYRPRSNWALTNALVDGNFDECELIEDAEKVTELTLDEVADKFGIDVKKLRIKD